jgi:hypothetical protein
MALLIDLPTPLIRIPFNHFIFAHANIAFSTESVVFPTPSKAG